MLEIEDARYSYTQGWINSKQGTVQKNVGPLIGGGRPYFSWRNMATFLVITVRVSAVSFPEKNGDLFW